MNEFGHERREEGAEVSVPAKDCEQLANEVCELALNDAKEQLHLLMRISALRQLRKRTEFMQAFKLALQKDCRNIGDLAAKCPSRCQVR